jgi:hypothetical protein
MHDKTRQFRTAAISRWRNAIRFSAVLPAVLLAGCASVQGVRSDRGSGETRDFEGSAENAWRASVLTAAELGLRLEELDPDHRFVIATKGGSATSYGEIVGFFLNEDTVVGHQSVEVVSRRRLTTNAFAKDWTEEALWTVGLFLARLEAAEAGKHLPVNPVTGPWLRSTDLDTCMEVASAETLEANLVLSPEEVNRCRKEAGGAPAEEACVAERTRVRSNWPVHADPGFLTECLATRREDRKAGLL